jgi:outer membrane protein insertion porin family
MRINVVKVLSILTSIVFLSFGNVQAAPISKIVIEGNERIETTTVLGLITIQEGQTPTQQQIDDNLKSIYNSNYFSDVSIKQEGSSLVVRVVENPSINRIVFEGNKNISDKIFNTEVKIQPRQLLNKNKIYEEVQRILAIYQAKGYFGAKVTPQIIKREQNRVDVIFEILEGPSASIRSIKFVGNKKFMNDQLRQIILTKEAHWWRFFANDDVYVPTRLEGDRENLRKFYLSKGYADFRVVSAVAELVPARDGFIITFTLEEGERYQFGDVTVQNTIPYLKVEEIIKKLGAKKGDWYSTAVIEKDTETITNIAGDHGYAFVEIQPIPSRDEEKRAIKLVYKLVEGPKVFINKINIIGNSRTIDSVIRRQILVAEGDPFNSTKLRTSDRNLQNLGFFKRVELKSVPVVGDPEKTDEEVLVEEQSTGEINFSAGYNTSEGPFGMVNFTERNLFGRAYEFSSRVYYAKLRQSLDVSFQDPYFLNKDLVAGVGGGKAKQNQESESSYTQDQTSGRVWMGYHLSEFLIQKWNYLLAVDKIGSINANAAPQIREQSGKKTVSFVGHTLSYDTRDFKFSPTSGYVATMNNDLAGLGGNVRFTKNVIGGEIYFTPLDEITFGIVSEAGIAQGLGQKLRVNDKFHLGGTSLRGFEYGGVGPHSKLGNRDDLGGDRLFTLSTEATFPLGISRELGIRGSVFLDSGTTWDSKETSSNVYNDKGMRVAAGFGFGWASPMGLIRVDFGFPLIKKMGDKTSMVLVNFGTGRF